MAARPLGEIPRKELSLQLSLTNLICSACPDQGGDGDDVDGEEVYVNADNDDEEGDGDGDGDDSNDLGQKTSGRVTVFHVCDAHSRI